jgi:hypothetical protein
MSPIKIMELTTLKNEGWMRKTGGIFLAILTGLFLMTGLVDSVWAAERAIRLTVPECAT